MPFFNMLLKFCKKKLNPPKIRSALMPSDKEIQKKILEAVGCKKNYSANLVFHRMGKGAVALLK